MQYRACKDIKAKYLRKPMIKDKTHKQNVEGKKKGENKKMIHSEIE